MKRLSYILLILLLVGCKAKQITTEKIITVHDTIKKVELREVQVPINNIITIEEPCDSLGILKDFKQTVKTKTVYVTIEGKDGELTASVNLDSIKQVAVKEYISRNKSDSETITITKYKIPKWAWYALIYSILATLYIFRKFIPYLKLLPF